jgi:hypothetical protein
VIQGSEEVEVRGKLRERWVVVTREPSGEEHFYAVRTKHDANWYVNILRQNEAQRRSELVMLESHPFGETIMKLTPKQRDIVRGLFEAEANLRNPAEQ